MEELSHIDLLDQAISLVAPRNCGKSHLLTHLLLETLKLKNDNETIINVTVFCKSLIDSNLYFKLYLHVYLDCLGFEPSIQAIKLIDEFELKEHLTTQSALAVTTNESDHTIKTILQTFIIYLQTQGYIQKKTNNNKFFRPCRFYFNGSIQPSILTKLVNLNFKTTKPRKYIVIIDDVTGELYKPIKKDIVFIYEQGRHHDLSVIVVDQYIRSTKVPPEIRLRSSYLMFRDYDETIKKEICNACALNKNQLDNENIRNLIKEYYAIVIDFNDKSKLFYIKAPKNLFNCLYPQIEVC